MYEQDSFYTLSHLEKIGVLSLSILLSAVLVWAVLVLTKHKGVVLKIVISLGVFYLFVWLSPQLYYTYYLMIFDGLPIQIVIKAPPNPIDIVKLLLFQGKASFSAHGKGVLGLSLVAVSIASALKSSK